jgi:hypothetical protein
MAMLTDADCVRYPQPRALKPLMRNLISVRSLRGLFLLALAARGEEVPLNAPRIPENSVIAMFAWPHRPGPLQGAERRRA